VPTTRRYRVVVQWDHHYFGPQMERVASEGSSIRRALNSALLSFFSSNSARLKRSDAHTHVRCEIWRLKSE